MIIIVLINLDRFEPTVCLSRKKRTQLTLDVHVNSIIMGELSVYAII